MGMAAAPAAVGPAAAGPAVPDYDIVSYKSPRQTLYGGDLMDGTIASVKAYREQVRRGWLDPFPSSYTVLSSFTHCHQRVSVAHPALRDGVAELVHPAVVGHASGCQLLGK
jgi:hypothetical protein